MQNLSAAIMTSVADTIGTKVDMRLSGDISLQGLRAIWWFGFARGTSSGIDYHCLGEDSKKKKKEEKEHVT